MRKIIVLCLVAVSGLGACDSYRGLITSDERRIWVVQHASGDEQVYRCSDVADGDQPPRPVCVRSVMANAVPPSP